MTVSLRIKRALIVPKVTSLVKCSAGSDQIEVDRPQDLRYKQMAPAFAPPSRARRRYVSDLATNQTKFFTSEATIELIPTAWGIFKTASGALQAASSGERKIDELTTLVRELTKTLGEVKSQVSQMHSQITSLRSELDTVKRGVLTVRVRQEKALLIVGMRTHDIATIVAKHLAPAELAQMGMLRPTLKVPIKNDPFAGAPELA